LIVAKAKALFSARQRLVPQYGVIEGGLLDGWAYAFVRVEVDKAKVFLVVRGTKPKWPFPELIRLSMADYIELRNPGMTAPTHEMQKLIDAVIEHVRTGPQK